ncbi:conserved hypothetical protein [Candida tropicalis MYA-3404]|uniref:FAD/NAD(P)-binding domain-containing protein n=1 Tax=Candida tropicalis (strain ATCC MYA-3404 / T1) TaxID=294747 RepID=C5MB25_CANTT|nr:conserved hypothetical protein [Candida tropicalis MYA-3404]EER32842.1 conserved hypothetical protein [Candida tropicalis MYA-3404]KAG4406669.1 hypothetical protein JTP64_004053 [Candida tropicalis]
MNLDPIQIPQDNFFEVLVIGGGTCGLSISARLLETHPGSLFTEDEHQRFHWLKQRGNKVNLINSKHSNYQYKQNFSSKDILILDSLGDKFMTGWNSQFDACKIPYLRSPMFFHVDPVNIDGMVSFAHLNNRNNELMEITNVVGKEYSKHQQKRIMEKKKKKTKKKMNGKKENNHDSDGIVEINMRDYRDYYRPSTKLFHDYCQEIIQRYNLESRIKQDEVISIDYKLIQVDGESDEIGKGLIITTKNGHTYGCKSAILATGHRGDINYPISPFIEEAHFPESSCHTTHLFNKQVSFLQDCYFNNPKSKRIVIIGGGLTSAQLAYVAAQDPTVSSITLLFRSGIKIKHFDFHLDWVTKYRNVKKSSFYILDTDEEKIEMINNAREGGSINPEYYKKLIKLTKTNRISWKIHTKIIDQNWNIENKSWDLKIMNNENNEIELLKNIDYIYFATGISENIESLEFLKPMINENPIDIVGGYPCLTDNLQWNNEVPLFMLGKNAALRMGPTSANLDGARLGAERIGWYLQDLKQRGEFDWSPVKSITKDDERERESNTYETRLKLASGQLNWFTLLESS